MQPELTILERFRRWAYSLNETFVLAIDSMWSNRLRSFLAVSGVVIGIITVVMVASILSNVRDQIALLFRELGTENIFAFHLTGDPYSAPSEQEINRKPLLPAFAEELIRRGESISSVGVQVIVPGIVNGQPLTARAGGNESESVLVEGASSSFFEIVGADFSAGRPFTELEDRAGAKVAVIGPSLSRALYGNRSALGKSLLLAGETYFVVGELAPRRGGFFGENRQDSVLAIPAGTVARRFTEADKVILYVRAKEAKIEEARLETEVILRQLRGLKPSQPNDFTLSTADSIIRSFDALSAQIGLATVALATVSLIIGGIGIANVMVIAVTERTREIGLRRATGARRSEVLAQFVLESAILSAIGGVLGVTIALLAGLALKLFLQGFSAVPPVWAIGAGVGASVVVGIVAGFLPARRAALLDPVEALRHE